MFQSFNLKGPNFGIQSIMLQNKHKNAQHSVISKSALSALWVLGVRSRAPARGGVRCGGGAGMRCEEVQV